MPLIPYIGEIIIWSGELSPQNIALLRKKGFLVCDGDQVLVSDFHELFDVVRDTYRVPNTDPGKFRLPDLRGRAPIGAGQGPGLTARHLGHLFGAEAVALEITHLARHAHSMVGPGGGGEVDRYGHGGGHISNVGTGQTGDGTPHENMPPSIALHFLIRYWIPPRLAAALAEDHA